LENFDSGNEDDARSDRGGSPDTCDEDEADAEVASIASLDAIEEDTNRDERARAAGYMGKISAVRWVQSATNQLAQDLDDDKKRHQSHAMKSDNAFISATYHANDTHFPIIDPDEVNPLELPDTRTAEALIEVYFAKVHPFFPIVSERDFRRSFEAYMKRAPLELSYERQGWLCILNVIFAIAAKFAHITNADYQGDNRDHLPYYSRARALGIDNRTLHRDPDLQHTSCLGLISLYLLVIDQINR
jgi:hypothetical protein